MMLSEGEAVDFAQSKLNVPDVLSRARHRSLHLVTDLTRAFHLLVPFQNISLLSQPPGTQRVPTLEEIKRDVTALWGGLCYTNNVFMHYLLGALGYDVNFLSATCNPKHPDNHIMNLCVCGEDSQSVIVDVGCGYPTYQPIPFPPSLTTDTSIYTSGFLNFSFRKCPVVKEKVERVHAPLGWKRNQSTESWSRFYDFIPTPRPLEYFSTSMGEVYEDRFLKKFRVVTFDETGMTAIKEQGNGTVRIDVRSGNWTEDQIGDDQDLVKEVKRMTSRLDDAMVIDAIRNWRYFKSRQRGTD